MSRRCRAPGPWPALGTIWAWALGLLRPLLLVWATPQDSHRVLRPQGSPAWRVWASGPGRAPHFSASLSLRVARPDVPGATLGRSRPALLNDHKCPESLSPRTQECNSKTLPSTLQAGVCAFGALVTHRLRVHLCPEPPPGPPLWPAHGARGTAAPAAVPTNVGARSQGQVHWSLEALAPASSRKWPGRAWGPTSFAEGVGPWLGPGAHRPQGCSFWPSLASQTPVPTECGGCPEPPEQDCFRWHVPHVHPPRPPGLFKIRATF